MAGEDAWLSPVVAVNSSDGPADAVDLGTMGWDGHFIPAVLLPKTHSLGLIMRKHETNSNQRTSYKIPDQDSSKLARSLKTNEI